MPRDPRRSTLAATPTEPRKICPALAIGRDTLDRAVEERRAVFAELDDGLKHAA
jgi:hypothetical protein